MHTTTNPNAIKKVLTIAGFDASGGAGIQADLKTFQAWGCFGMSVLTALPIQNTQGVRGCYALPLVAIEDQLQCLFDDIQPDAVKIGMLFDEQVIGAVASFLKSVKPMPTVVDPVMVAKSGDPLLSASAINSLVSHIFPLATLITPNIPEASALCGTVIEGTEQMIDAAHMLQNMGAHHVLLKGGHLGAEQATDLLLLQGGARHWLALPKIQSQHTHGTGCTLSAAIAALLAHGESIQSACWLAKKYVHQAIAASQNWHIGQGHGPLHHAYHQGLPFPLSSSTINI